MKPLDAEEDYLHHLLVIQDNLQHLKDNLGDIQEDTCKLYALIEEDKDENA